MTRDTPTQPSPTHVGPYRIETRIGRGGMGEVYRAHDARLDRPVALKRVRAGKVSDQARDRLQREARALARVRHPTVVEIHDWVEDESGDWLVMEWLDGRSLRDALTSAPPATERALAITRELASGLAAIHDQGIVHRDIKPDNVMVLSDGSLKILDLGLAKRVASKDGRTLTETISDDGQLLGTVRFMSPEQAGGQRLDARSDLFSLGVLLYEMLTGVAPFGGDTPVETLTRICTWREVPAIEHDPALPRAVSDWVGRLLEKEPQRRPRDAREVTRVLDALHDGVVEGASEEALLALLPHDREPVDDTAETLAELLPSQATPAPSPTAPSPTAPSPTAPSPSTPSPTAPASATSSQAFERAGITPRLLVGLATALTVIAAAWWFAGSSENHRSTSDSRSIDADLDAHDHYRRGMDLLKRYDETGHIDAAIAEFQRALALDEASAPSLAGLARAYWLDFKAGTLDPQRLRQAAAAAESAVEHGEYFAVAHVSRGMVHVETGSSDAARADFERALELEPLHAEAHFGLALLHASQGDTTAAETAVRQAIEVATPPSWRYFSFLGDLAIREARYEEAADAFRLGLDQTPDNFLLLRNSGVAHYMQGDLAAAASDFQRALEIEASHSLYANLGTIYFAQGLYTRAVEAFEKSVETKSGASSYLLWANLADAYRWTPDNAERARETYARAIRLLDERLDAAPDDPKLLTRRALYQAKRGDCSNALTGIGDLASLAETSASAWYRVTVANEVCGRRDAALDALRTALDAGFAVSQVRADPELIELRRDRRFEPLTIPAE